MTEEDRIQINEAIFTFYKLKNDYQTNFYDHFVKNIVNSGRSRNEKKNLYKKLPKPPCINCKRNVSTLFSVKNIKDTHIYNAKCGDITDPCPLDIRISVPLSETYEKLFIASDSSIGSINLLKTKIIKAKNDLLFGYTTERNAFQIFEKLTEELKGLTEIYEYYLEEYILTTDNPVKNELLKKKRVELEMQIKEFKSMIDEFNKNENPQIMNTAMEFYINSMMPTIKEIEKERYAYNKVEYINNEYILLQKKNTLDQLIVEYEEPKLESFVVGNKDKKGSKKVKPIVSNKTKKNKPKPVFVIQDEEKGEEAEEK